MPTNARKKQKPHRYTRLIWLSCGMVAAASLAACSSSGGASKTSTGTGTPTSSSTATTSTSSSNSILGADKPTSGTVKIGFSSAGSSAAIDTTGEVKAAQAVVAYANAKLGGIGGKAISLDVCLDKASPATAQSCANQFVSDKVIAVTSGSDPEAPAVAKIVTAANIPYTADLATDPAILGSKLGFSITSPVVPIAGPAAIAKAKGYKHVAIFNIDTPSSTGGIKALAPSVYGAAGAKVDVIPIAPGTADATTQVQAEAAKHPDLIHLIGDPTFCATVLKAIRSLNITTPVTGIDRCINATSNSSVPGGFAGVTIVSTVNTDATSAEYKLYTAVMNAYGAGSYLSDPSAPIGYQGLLSVIRALNGAKITDMTAAGALAALQSAPAEPLALGTGATFQCNGKATPISPAICTAAGFSASADKDGKLSNFQPLPAA